jgi:serine/threonine-protein kinase HipA
LWPTNGDTKSEGKELKKFVFCDVPLLGFKPAGIFELSEVVDSHGIECIGQFVYLKEYLELKNACAVDPINLPLRSGTFKTELNGGFFGTIRDAMPDYWGRLVLAKTHNVLDEFDILTQSKPDRIGHLDFRPSVDSPAVSHSLPTLADVSSVLSGSQSIQEMKEVPESVSSLFLSGTTIGGARPKINLMVDGELWLAKLPALKDRYSNARVECAMLTVAQKLGIQTPEHRLYESSGEDILLLKRFDREGGKRMGMMSALSLLSADEQDRHINYVDLAQKLIINQAQKDAKELFKRVVLNGMVNNTDDHARNHACLFDGQHIRLSPVYDITPTIARPGLSTTRYHALHVGFTKEASLENYLIVCEDFLVERYEAIEIFKEVAEVVHQMPTHLNEVGVRKEEQDMLSLSFLFGRSMSEVVSEIEGLSKKSPSKHKKSP